MSASAAMAALHLLLPCASVARASRLPVQWAVSDHGRRLRAVGRPALSISRANRLPGVKI